MERERHDISYAAEKLATETTCLINNHLQHGLFSWSLKMIRLPKVLETKEIIVDQSVCYIAGCIKYCKEYHSHLNAYIADKCCER